MASSKIEAFMKAVRNSTIGRQVIPMETITGWPIVMRKDGKVYVKLIYFGIEQKEKGKTLLYPPLVSIMAEFDTVRIVQYKDLRFEENFKGTNWSEACGKFPHTAVVGMKVKEYKQYKNDLLDLYDEMIEKMKKGDEFSEAWEKNFSILLSTMIEEPLINYYKICGEKFFNRFIIDLDSGR